MADLRNNKYKRFYSFGVSFIRKSKFKNPNTRVCQYFENVVL